MPLTEAERLEVLEKRMDLVEGKLSSSPIASGILTGVVNFFKNNPKITVPLGMLLAAIASALTTYSSVPTKEVPGPEKTIIREVPAKTAPKNDPAKADLPKSDPQILLP